MVVRLLPLLMIAGALPALGAQPMRCLEGKMRVTAGGTTRVKSLAFCHNYDRTYLISRNCAVPRTRCKARDTAHATEAVLSLSKKDKNPGFTLCRKLGGQPEIVEFLSDGVWYGLDRCLFGEDQSFIDTAHLFALQRNAAHLGDPPAEE